jgi:23S rRNA pseudouridine1911/1915/1917 synthase
MFQNYHIPPASAEQTLAAALRHFLPGQSWGQVRQLIRSRRVQVNGNLCLDAARRLKPGEVVKVWEHPLAKPVEEADVRIVYLDPHLVVVQKPAGITTLRHREERDWPERRKQRQPTLDELLTRILVKKHYRGAPARRGAPLVRAVHRLDRDTSGLMVFARTVPAERLLVQQFAHHTIHRKYVAVVHGDCRAQTIQTQLVRDRGDGRRGSGADEQSGQQAVTHVKPLERLGPYTLVECQLETGRTHQIRIHLSECGHMVCGDKLYVKPAAGKPLADLSGAPRQALHAAELGFQHPITGEALFFRMPLPEDLQEFVDRLRHQAGKPDSQTATRQPSPRPAQRSRPGHRRRQGGR